MTAALLLARREIQRFLREPSRIAAAVGTPFLFWLLIGTGLSASFRAPGGATAAGGAGAAYSSFFFPGALALVVFFTAIFSTISIIEDRKEGFLQGVLVAPVPRASILWGKILGGGGVATIQGGLFLLLYAATEGGVSAERFLLTLCVLFFVSAVLVLLGCLLAWRFDSTQGFHAVMNLILMPLWVVSGSVFPIAGAPPALAFLVRANPLTYGVALLRRSLSVEAAVIDPALPGLAASGLVVAISFAVLYVMARKTIEAPRA